MDFHHIYGLDKVICEIIGLGWLHVCVRCVGVCAMCALQYESQHLWHDDSDVVEHPF